MSLPPTAMHFYTDESEMVLLSLEREILPPDSPDSLYGDLFSPPPIPGFWGTDVAFTQTILNTLCTPDPIVLSPSPSVITKDHVLDNISQDAWMMPSHNPGYIAFGDHYQRALRFCSQTSDCPAPRLPDLHHQDASSPQSPALTNGFTDLSDPQSMSWQPHPCGQNLMAQQPTPMDYSVTPFPSLLQTKENVVLSHTSDPPDDSWDTLSPDLENPIFLSNEHGLPPPQSSQQLKRKRARNAVKLSKKLEIIAAWQKQPNMPALVQQFCIPRTTLLGIINKREAILKTAQSQTSVPRTMETSRLVEARFYILELLLESWVNHLCSRFIPISNKKITGQALEINRMLSGLLAVPFPPCLFTSGWLKGFKRRRNLAKQLQGLQPESVKVGVWVNSAVRRMLECYRPENTYTCDVASMFSGMMPLGLFRSESRQTPVPRADASSVSVLLCCNATGQIKQPPLVLVRQSPKETSHQAKDGPEPSPVLEDLTGRMFEDWLTDFDMGLSYDAVLLIDEAMWRFLRMGQTVSSLPLRFLKVVPVPSPLSALLPMSARITKEFKAHYHTLLISAYKDATVQAQARAQVQPLEKSLAEDMDVISEAWNHVQTSTVISCFQDFFHSINLPYLDHVEKEVGLVKEDAAEVILIRTLKSAINDIPESVVQYYATQDMYTGPSTFLRAEIQAMQKHPEFEGFFSNLTFGNVIFGSEEPRGRRRLCRFKSVECALPPPSRRAALQASFPMFSQPNLAKTPSFQQGEEAHRAGVAYMLRTLS